jgi:hypothetical protein
VDLTIGSFNFRVGSLGSVRLSDPINSGSSAGKTAAVTISEISVGSSSEVNSPVSINPAKGSTVEKINNLMENLDLAETSGFTDRGFDENFEETHNHSEGDVMVCNGNVPSNSEDK